MKKEYRKPETQTFHVVMDSILTPASGHHDWNRPHHPHNPHREEEDVKHEFLWDED